MRNDPARERPAEPNGVQRGSSKSQCKKKKNNKSNAKTHKLQSAGGLSTGKKKNTEARKEPWPCTPGRFGGDYANQKKHHVYGRT